MNTYKYKVAEYFLSALIYGDYSGLEDEEVLKIDSFQKRVIENHGYGHWSYSDFAPEFDRCDIVNLAANCVDIEWVVI